MSPMSWLWIIFIYINIWALVTFMVLPWGNRASAEPMPGQAVSAPEKPRIFVKILVSLVLSAFVTAGTVWLIQNFPLQIRNSYEN